MSLVKMDWTNSLRDLSQLWMGVNGLQTMSLNTSSSMNTGFSLSMRRRSGIVTKSSQMSWIWFTQILDLHTIGMPLFVSLPMIFQKERSFQRRSSLTYRWKALNSTSQKRKKSWNSSNRHKEVKPLNNFKLICKESRRLDLFKFLMIKKRKEACFVLKTMKSSHRLQLLWLP